VGVFTEEMADHERQQRERLRALRNNHDLARFTVAGRAIGKQLGTGSYGSVEEVYLANNISHKKLGDINFDF
jgi:hypothetical protein